MNKKCLFSLLTTVSLFTANVNGAPMAYSVNSDGQNASTWDSLYLIDLAADGSDQRRGSLSSGGVFNHYDTEGLAFSPDGVLWGVDDDSRILFPINTQTGSINFQEVISLNSFPSDGGNDFGMTFACDGSLYLTSVVNSTLYEVDLNGNTKTIGTLGANISAIAAIGNPTRLYGLGNGLYENGEIDSPFLFSISTESGLATPIGPLTNVLPYEEAGLAFDSDGTLWAITDRSKIDNQPSQVLRVDPGSGLATPISVTLETGFESLAIASPTNCSIVIPATYEDPYHRIPTLGSLGLLGTILSILFAGLLIIHRRVS